MRRRRQQTSGDSEDLLGLSGWLYSDLLLGIAVVFLAAVSFETILPVVAEVPIEEVQEEVEPLEPETVELRQCLAGIALDHVEVFVARDLRGQALADAVMGRVQEALSDQAVIDPSAVTFGFMLAFGGAEDPNQGISYARAVSDSLIASMPERFERVVTRSYWGGRSADLSQRVRLDVFPYITEPCDDE